MGTDDSTTARNKAAGEIRHASQRALLAELGQAALQGAELDILLDRACELLAEVLQVEYTKVLLEQHPGGPLVLAAGRGWNRTVEVGKTVVPSGRDSQAGFTLASAQPVVVSDLATEARFAAPALLRDHGVTSGMSAAIVDRDRAYGVVGIHTATRREFCSDDVDLLRLVANIVGGAIENHRYRRQIRQQSAAQEHRARYQTAIAQCARALLASRGEERLLEALRALLSATQATFGFVERNVDDADLGFCSSTVAEVSDDGDAVLNSHDRYWSLVPWDRMPESRSRLERGEPFALVPAALSGPERELYDAAPNRIESEIDIPIFVDGKWEGLVGFADVHSVRDWSQTDVSLLSAAASMIGAYWEREQSKAELQEMITSKDEFIATVSHELRTPLTAILGLAEELHMGIDRFPRGELESLLTLIASQSADMAYLIDDLLVAAKSSNGQLSARPVDIDLEREIKAVALQLGLAGRITIQGVADAWADPYRVRQIIRNLLTNADRYGGCRLVVNLTTDGPYAELSVEDDGPGIPEEARPTVFERYERGHQRFGQTQSIGLGLAVSRQLARLMGGDLSYRRTGVWSCFALRLPRSSAAAPFAESG